MESEDNIMSTDDELFWYSLNTFPKFRDRILELPRVGFTSFRYVVDQISNSGFSSLSENEYFADY